GEVDVRPVVEPRRFSRGCLVDVACAAGGVSGCGAGDASVDVLHARAAEDGEPDRSCKSVSQFWPSPVANTVESEVLLQNFFKVALPCCPGQIHKLRRTDRPCVIQCFIEASLVDDC